MTERRGVHAWPVSTQKTLFPLRIGYAVRLLNADLTRKFGAFEHLYPRRKVLWSRALNQCAFPTCRQLLTEDSVDAATGETLTNAVGEQAHIRSYKTNGPRYDPDYPKSKLHTYENLILLCPT